MMYRVSGNRTQTDSVTSRPTSTVFPPHPALLGGVAPLAVAFSSAALLVTDLIWRSWVGVMQTLNGILP